MDDVAKPNTGRPTEKEIQDVKPDKKQE